MARCGAAEPEAEPARLAWPGAPFAGEECLLREEDNRLDVAEDSLLPGAELAEPETTETSPIPVGVDMSADVILLFESLCRFDSLKFFSMAVCGCVGVSLCQKQLQMPKHNTHLYITAHRHR